MEKKFDKIRIIIAGSRSFDNYDKLCKEVDEFISLGNGREVQDE